MKSYWIWLNEFRFPSLECGGFFAGFGFVYPISVVFSVRKKRKINKWNNNLNYLHRWLLILCLMINQQNHNKATDNRSFVKYHTPFQANSFQFSIFLLSLNLLFWGVICLTSRVGKQLTGCFENSWSSNTSLKACFDKWYSALLGSTTCRFA